MNTALAALAPFRSFSAGPSRIQRASCSNIALANFSEVTFRQWVAKKTRVYAAPRGERGSAGAGPTLRCEPTPANHPLGPEVTS